MAQTVVARPFGECDLRDVARLHPDRIATTRRVDCRRFLDDIFPEHLAQFAAHLRRESRSDFSAVVELTIVAHESEVKRADLASGGGAVVEADDDELLLVE